MFDRLTACNLCGTGIRPGYVVTVNQKPYHPGCAGKIAKEKKDAVESERNETDAGTAR
jgi:hypothetical protein